MEYFCHTFGLAIHLIAQARQSNMLGVEQRPNVIVEFMVPSKPKEVIILCMYRAKFEGALDVQLAMSVLGPSFITASMAWLTVILQRKVIDACSGDERCMMSCHLQPFFGAPHLAG